MLRSLTATTAAVTVLLGISPDAVAPAMTVDPPLEVAAESVIVDHEHVADEAAPAPTEHRHDHVDPPELAPPVSISPGVTVVGGTEDDAATVDVALELFRGAGLLLPDIEILFHDDPDDCRGHDGLFQAQHTPWRVLVCTDLAYVLTHELAHAWEASNLADADRDHYVEHRGLPTWNDPDAEWSERGVEDAAFMMQQNLMAGCVDIDSDRWIERTDAYEALTGKPSPVLAPANSALGRRRGC